MNDRPEKKLSIGHGSAGCDGEKQIYWGSIFWIIFYKVFWEWDGEEMNMSYTDKFILVSIFQPLSWFRPVVLDLDRYGCSYTKQIKSTLL